MASSIITTSGLKGVGVCSPHISIDTLSPAPDTYADQSGPHAGGVGIPGGPPSSTADLLGSMSATGIQREDVIVEVLQGGLPGLALDSMRVGYRSADEASSTTRGWTDPTIISDAKGFEATVNGIRGAAVSSTGRCILITSTAALVEYYPDSTNVTYMTGPVAGSNYGTVFFDENDVLYVICDTNAGRYGMYRENPDPTILWDQVADDPFDINPVNMGLRLRVLVLPNGEWSCFAMQTGITRQYASSNRGTTWTTVAYDTTTYPSAFHGDVAKTLAGSIVFVVAESGTGDIYAHRIANAWDNVFLAPAIQVGGDGYNLWLAQDPGGLLWIMQQHLAAAGTVTFSYSYDGGQTFTSTAKEAFRSVLTSMPENGQLIFAGGDAHLFAQQYGVSSNALYIRFGGWENSQYTEGFGTPAAITKAGSWVMRTDPSADATWTESKVGSPVFGYDSTTGSRRLLTASGESWFWLLTGAVDNGANAQITAQWKMKANTTSGLARNGARLRVSNGTNYSEVWVYVRSTSFVVQNTAGSPVATVALGTSSPVTFRASIQYNGRVSVEYHIVGNPWALAWETTSAGTTAGTAGFVRFGAMLAGASGDSADWYFFEAASSTGGDLSPRNRYFTSIAKKALIGKLVGQPPLLLGPGVSNTASAETLAVSATAGPTMLGDTFTFKPRYDYPIEAIIPSVQPSPRVAWRGVIGDGDEALIEFNVNEYGLSLGRSMIFGMMNVNFRRAYLEYMDLETLDWVALGTWDAQLAGNLESLTTGNVVRIAPDSPPLNRYIWANELCHGGKGTVDLGGYKHRIESHTEGLWSTAPGKHVELRIDIGDFDLEPVATTAIWHHSGILVLHNVTAIFQKIRIRIPGSELAHGSFEHQIGNVMLGPIITMGQQQSRGGTIGTQRNASSSETADLVSRVKRLGPTRKTWSMAWTDGLDQTELRSANPTPDYLANNTPGSEGLANWRDVPYLLSGTLDILKSGEVPVVVLNPIPATSGTMVLDPTLWLYGRIDSDVGVESVTGTEGQSEVLRVSNIVFTEIP